MGNSILGFFCEHCKYSLNLSWIYLPLIDIANQKNTHQIQMDVYTDIVYPGN